MKMVGTYNSRRSKNKSARRLPTVSAPTQCTTNNLSGRKRERRTFMKALLLGAGSFCIPLRNAHAQAGQKVLRIAMTLSDIPYICGQATGGAEGIRFVGFSLYDALVRWDFEQNERPTKIIPNLGRELVGRSRNQEDMDIQNSSWRQVSRRQRFRCALGGVEFRQDDEAGRAALRQAPSCASRKLSRHDRKSGGRGRFHRQDSHQGSGRDARVFDVQHLLFESGAMGSGRAGLGQVCTQAVWHRSVEV